MGLIKMNEYTKQANDFLKSTDTKLTIKFIKVGFYFDGDKETRRIYRVNLKNKNHSYWFNFGDSIHNKEKGLEPDNYAVLSCLNIDYCETYQDFCDEFGYELQPDDKAERIQNIKTYRAVKAQTKNLKLLFNNSQLEQLHEVN